NSDPAPECQTMVLEHDSLSPRRKCQENVSHGDKTVTTLNEMDLLYSPMIDELFNGSSQASVHNSTDPGPTRKTMASVQNSTDPGPTRQAMASVQISSDPAPKYQTMALEHDSLSPGRNCHENVVFKSSAISAADAPNQRQQPTTPLNNHTTPVPTCPNPPISTSVISSENINQAEPHAENAQVADDEFINIFS
nr:hypothetical protein [Tanacetum cinerariifolium]